MVMVEDDIEQNHKELRKRLQFLEDRLRAIEGIKKYNFKALDLCLVANVTIPHKFKVPDFDKYKGNSCPRNHLISYC
ncbi:hypothetical protein CR513_22748, partial [Mucuna pruriens]